MTTADRPAQARAYARRKRQLWLVELLWTLGLCLLALGSGVAASLAAWAESLTTMRWLAITCYGLVLGGLLELAQLPLNYYSGFALEHRYGLSTQTFPQWAWKYLKQVALGAPLGWLFLQGLYLTIDHGGALWWLWLAVAWWAVTVVLARILPTVIIPLFYKCVPLQDAALRQTLKDLSTRVRVPVMDSYRIDLSRETKKANAAVVGWGKTRRVLIADTLLANFAPEEITAVVAHELGHHRLHHIPVHLAASFVSTAAGFWLLDAAARQWLPGSVAELAWLPALVVLLTLLNTLLMPAHNGLSRLMERQADQFALEVTQAPQPFIATMRKLADINLAETTPARWVEWWFYSHPAIARRIQMGEAFVPARSGSG